MSFLIPLPQLAEQISNAPSPQGMRTKIIAIDGCGGAGKSTLASKLMRHLDRCAVIHTDDFASWDNPLNWYPRLIDQVLIPLSKNEIARFQRFDWTEKVLSNWISIEPQDYVILEGVSSSRKEFRKFLSFSIFVRATREIRLQRGLERDGQGAQDQWLKWMSEEDNYLKKDDPENFANIIIDGEAGDGESVAIVE